MRAKHGWRDASIAVGGQPVQDHDEIWKVKGLMYWDTRADGHEERVRIIKGKRTDTEAVIEIV
jgi:hypothetical protein